LEIPVEFVGNPLLDIAIPHGDKEVLKDNLGISKDKVLIGLLPGSRESEIKKHLPIMLEVAKIVGKEISEAEFVFPMHPSLAGNIFADRIISQKKVIVRIFSGEATEIMQAADLILVASGTATLEAARYSCPMVIIYKISFLTWLLVRPLIKVPFVGLVNLIAKEKIVPEYLQFQANPGKIARECLSLLRDEEKRSDMINNLHLVRQSLGEPGASRQAARAVLKTIEKGNHPSP